MISMIEIKAEKQRHAELLRAVEQRRMIAALRAGQPRAGRWYSRVLTRLGAWGRGWHTGSDEPGMAPVAGEPGVTGAQF